ncbi:glycerophosphodiester phosphodiesterase family protein [Aquimarina macrocephali]|uniref:glycerophosphodiester phosphodiesterase family protein n=1 Tax=Aquimarina macrocephali TaxID=666563 RepID=UPI000465638F|nr:glycerophosphodiester phosphodiesterase family protein [Aquimarina macrocephali]
MEIVCYGCGRGENPENTIEGIHHCQSINPDWWIEMDIQITKDEKLVLFHDYQTKRITGVNNKIHQLTLTEIQQLNAGYNFNVENKFIYRENPIQIPTVEEVFQKFPKAKLLLDLHTNNLLAVTRLITLIKKYTMANQVIIVSRYDEVISSFKKKRPKWRYGVPTKEAKKMIYSSFLYLDKLFPITSDILMLPKKAGKVNVLTKRVVKHVKKRNKTLWAWMYEGEIVKTVDDETELNEMKELGVHGIFTGFPKKLMNQIQ